MIGLWVVLWAAPVWVKPPPVPNDCAAYCDAMALRCPDVFLGNRTTCEATCALYPLGGADVDALRCAVYGQTEAEPVPQPALSAAKAAEVGPSDERWWDDHPQLRGDRSVVPAGMGAVFVPAITRVEPSPLLTVYDGGKAVAEGRMGRRVLLKPGRYVVRFGDGAQHQQVTMPVRIEAGRTTVVPEAYGALEINVVDPQFVPFRGSYELLRVDTREVVGLGFGADALLGEALKVWLLAPGVYKLVQSGGTYRDRTNFSTVRVMPGEKTRFVLVMNPDTGDFEGAGLVPEGTSDDSIWTFSGVLGGDVAFLRRDVNIGQPGWSLAFDVFFDVVARLHTGPHRWASRLEVEESQTRPAQTEQFLNLEDRIFLHSIYTYEVVDWFGPYIRAGAEMQVLPRTLQFDDARDIELQDGTVEERTEVEVASEFLPLVELIEGTGGNFRLWRSRALELQVRAGVGARQLFPTDLDVLIERDGPDRLVTVEEDLTEGVESTAIGSARLTRWVTLSTEFDSLYPFDPDQSFIFTWRNQVNLRLASFASITYRFNAERNPAKLAADDVQTEHDVQLRFSYTLF